MPIPALGVPLEGGTSPVSDTPATLSPGYRSVLSWITAYGEEITLTGDISGTSAGIIVQPGIKGFEAPPYAVTFDELPALDGASWRWSRATTREIFIPLFLWAPTHHQLVTLRRDLLNKFNPKLGPGTLKVTEYSEDGTSTTSRYIDCYNTSGMEGDDQDASGFTYCTYGMVLQAPNPFWYGAMQTPQALKLGSDMARNFFTGKPRGDSAEHTGNFIGINLSLNAYVPPAGLAISNNGDLEAWPVWTIKASNATAMTIANNTSARSLDLTYTFGGDSDPVTIDTRPGFKTVTNGAGDNLWQYLSPGPQLWPLLQGDNDLDISFTPTGFSSVMAEVTYSFNPRYLGA